MHSMYIVGNDFLQFSFPYMTDAATSVTNHTRKHENCENSDTMD